MADTPAADQLHQRLAERFPDLTIPPHGALLLAPQQLLAVATALHDEFGYALLTNLSVTDWLADGQFEVVYHLVNIQGGAPVVLKVRVPRENPLVPSLTPSWPGADFQEREAFDLYGVQFEGHPELRRIYLWDEFTGFPMRRDFPKQGDKYFGAGESE